MKISRINVVSGAVVLLASALLSSPARASDAATDPLFACTEYQKTQIRSDIAEECGGSGTATVYCSWMGLYEIRSIDCW
ncbi:MAG TPA: hypothetical protein VGX50_12130 [Longimicrobium sp.]|jgi:hypothetical protein|nr:hypothetical protein [Longimicrobium sp.]